MIRVRTNHTFNVMPASQHRMALIDCPNVRSMLLCPHRCQDTASKTTSIGTSSSASLKMADIGSYLAIIRTFMTSRLRYSRNFRTRRTRKGGLEFYLTCQVQSLTSQMQSPTGGARALMITSRSSWPCLHTSPNASSSGNSLPHEREIMSWIHAQQEKTTACQADLSNLR